MWGLGYRLEAPMYMDVQALDKIRDMGLRCYPNKVVTYYIFLWLPVSSAE